MKRILFISQYLNRAGTEAFMMGVFRGIDHSRFQVDFLLYTQEETDYTREVEAAGGKVWRVTSRKESPLRWYSELNHFFRNHAKEYAAIHFCGNSLTTIAPLLFAYAYHIPIRISHAHNSSASGIHNRLLHLLQRKVAFRLTTHHFACSSMAGKWFFGSKPADIIKNGIMTEKFAYTPTVRDQIRAQYNISEGTTVIGHVGRFEAEKNHSFILDIFASYLKTNPKSILMLIGIGSLLESAKEKALALGLTDKVLFLGEQKNVNQLLQAFDIFLMPSTFEGQPFVLIEAQCAGLPCLVSDIINDDICLTPNVAKCSLKQAADKWAHQIGGLLDSFQRKDESPIIEKQGYALNTTISYLEKVYGGEK